MSYEVVLKSKASKGIVRLPTTVHARVVDAIDALAEDPRPRGSKKLQGTPAGIEDRRVRVGDYRIIYRLEEPHPDRPQEQPENSFDGRVTVLAVRHRQGAYG